MNEPRPTTSETTGAAAKAARPGRRRGPRVGRPDTRGAILDAARARFVERGYEGTTLRDVAADASVDVALVAYFFRNKDGLFAAAMTLPVNPAEIVAEVVAPGPDGLGARLVHRFLELWDDPSSGTALVGLVRSATTHEVAGAMVRGFVEREIVARLASAIEGPQAELRAALIGSQLVGLVMTRYVIGIQPVVDADAETLAAAVGPTLQRYLTGDIGLD